MPYVYALALIGCCANFVFGVSEKHYLEHGYHGLDLEADGSFQAVEMTDHQWKNASCSQGGFRDFYVDATAANLHDNLFVEIVHDPTEKYDVKLHSLSMHLFFNEIPADRITENVLQSSPDGVYPLAVNANEIKEGRYFISVKCGDFEDANFGILANFDTAELQEGIPRPYSICSKETLYHYLELSESDVKDKQYNVRFNLCAPSDSLSELAFVTKVNFPPLRKTEPQKLLSPSEANETDITDGSVCVTFDVCNSALGEGKIWAGVFGGGLCGKYNMTATFFGGVNYTDETCSTEMGGGSEENTASQILLEHVYRGSCKPFQWVDYELTLTDYDRSNNILFEVIDVSTGGINPRSLSVHLFSNSIPVDRITHNRADSSVSHVYAVFRTFLALNDMTNLDGSEVKKAFVSVRCGPTATRFKLLGEHITAHLESGHLIRGDVCSGSWVFHYIVVPENANASSTLSVELNSYEGYTDFTVLASHPPIRISPPYGISTPYTSEGSSSSASSSNSTEVSNIATICDVEPGLTYYIGVKISAGHDSHCAVYDILTTLSNDIGCSTPRQSAPDQGFQPVALTAHTPLSDSVESGGFQHYSIEIDEYHAHDNLVVEAELLVTQATSDYPDAIELMFFEKLPTDGSYATPFFAQKGKAGVWSVAISSHDLKQQTYYVVVKGTDIHPVRFRIVAFLIESSLVMGHRHHGEVCDSEWIYYSFNALSLNASSSSSSSSSHRRRLAKASPARALLESASDDDKGTTHGSKAVHLSIHIWRYSGSFYTRLAHGFAPIKLVPPFTFLGMDTDDITINICNVGLKYHGEAETVYLGLLGNLGCSLFDVVAHAYVGGNCTEPRSFASEDATENAVELQLEHFTYSSCTPGGFTDHYISISARHAHDNIIFEVETIGDASDPSALTVLLYEDSIPYDRESERRSEISSGGIFSVAVSSVDMHKGTYFLSVRCKASGISPSGGGGAERVRFRVAPLAISRDLEVGHTQHGELCQLEWIHHRFVLDNLTNYSSVVRDDDGHSEAGTYHIRMHIWKYTGDFFAMSSDHPPLKLMAPFVNMETSEHELVLDYCDLQINDEVWFGFLGGDFCAVYDVDIQLRSGECVNTVHERSERRLSISESTSSSATDNAVDVISSSSATEMEADKVYLSHCEPDSWVDFALRVGTTSTNITVNPEMSNIIFEVLLNHASKTNPTALSVYLHTEGHLPEQRENTEIFSETATNGVLSVSVPSGLVATTTSALFLSVRCGAAAVRFKAVAIVLDSQMVAEKHSLGEVCPGNWVYYHAERKHGYGTNVRFDVIKYEGSMSLIARSEVRPMRLTYPYTTISIPNEDQRTSVYACDLSVDEIVYLGVKGGSECASFSVTPFFFDGDCSAETNAEHTIQAQEDTIVPLIDGSWQYAHCARGGWSDVSFLETFTKGMTVENILIEVEVLKDEGVPLGSVLDATAISVYMFDGYPPVVAEREIEGAYLTRSLTSLGSMYTLFQSYIEVNKLIAALDSNTDSASSSMAIKCSDARELVRFRIMLHSIHAHLDLGHTVHGQTCPNGWVYHYVDLQSSTVGASHKRRLGDSFTSGNEIENKDERSLGKTSSSTALVNLRVSFRLLQGGVYQVSTRFDNPPTFTSTNSFDLELMAGPDPESTVALGYVVEYTLNLCNVGGHKSYLGVFGDESGCALYDIKAVEMAEDEKCVNGASRVVEV